MPTVSLALDGITGPKQKAIQKAHKPSVHQLMFFCNAWALVYLAIGIVVSGEGLAGIEFLLRPENAPLVRTIGLFAICSALGQNFIFYTLHSFKYAHRGTDREPLSLITWVRVSVLYSRSLDLRQRSVAPPPPRLPLS